MKIVIISSEAAPFAQTGGLGDVAGSLPKTLFRLGHEPILIMPLYRQVRENSLSLAKVGAIEVPIRGTMVPGKIWQGRVPRTDAPVYFIENDEYYDRDSLYGNGHGGFLDNCERFTFLSRGAIETVRLLEFSADAFHVHDWQTALVAPYLKLTYSHDELLRQAGTVLTIHNMAHQGIFWHWDMEVIGFDWQYFTPAQFEFWGKLNLLKAGILFADQVNTVSPTYAQEILTPEYGHGLDGVLRDRKDAVHGVVNGIDDAVWNPAMDPHLPATYGPEDLEGKATCKRSLQRQCELPQRKVPIVGIVSRFAEQKGLDIVARSLPGLFDRQPIQCVILGNGDDQIRLLLEVVAKQYPERLRVFARYDDRLAHRIIAGADIVCVPSRFEPCGLTQLYALKYGSVPVVRATGGLRDTVVDCTPDSLAAGRATGFTFDAPTPEGFSECLERALEVNRDPKAWASLVQAGMAQDWSWERSTRRYLDIYAAAKERAARL